MTSTTALLREPPDLDGILYQLERRDLEEVVPSLNPPLWGDLEGIPFIRVNGLASYWQDPTRAGYSRVMEDLLTSLYGEEVDFYFLVLGQGNRTGIFLGAGNANTPERLTHLLNASFPGIQLDVNADIHLGKSLDQGGFFRYRGRMTGVPGLLSPSVPRKPGRPAERNQSPSSSLSERVYPSSLERLIRGLQGSSWGFFLHAIPEPQSQIYGELNSLMSQIEKVQLHTRLQIQRLNQTMKKVNETTQAGETESVSTEIVNRRADYVLERLEMQLKRLQRARAEGGWEVDMHFFCPEAPVLKRMQALLRSVFTVSEESTEPIRTFLATGGQTGGAGRFSTLLTSSEISSFSYLPHEEVPGYQVTDFTVFDVHQKAETTAGSIPLGTILENGHDTGLSYAVPVENLSQHVMVTGVTGSGKTTLILSLLNSLWNRANQPGIPFLVIEPTKSEYRALLGRPAGSGVIPGVKIFTLGDENVCPFRLNPFQFEVLDSDHFTHVQTHIDYLKSVFSAAFVLYPPMPYVLEICLHEVYTDRGWDLTTSRNNRLPEKYHGQLADWPVFPTLTDLYYKIDEVTERLGYEERVKMDVKAGLQTRLRSMMIGGKGLLLNTPLDDTMEALLSEPAVLELERIGDDEEKTFLMGLLLMRLFEYRRLQFLKSNCQIPFQHLTVIEEAHRLLRAVALESGPDQSNIRGHAMETFTNILSEIRAYGEGILIAEQIPSKLTPDALKNTSLKILHRLVAEDDRRAVSAATNMTESQARYLVMMPRHEAAVFNQGDDHPLLLRVKPAPGVTLQTRPGDMEIRRAVRALAQGEPAFLLRIASATSDRPARVKEITSQVLADAEFRSAWSCALLRLGLDSAAPAESLASLRRVIDRYLYNDPQLEHCTLAQVVLDGSRTDFYQRSRAFGWNYEEARQFRASLLEGFSLLLQNQTSEAAEVFTAWQQSVHHRDQRQNGPYGGCSACNQRCFHRHDLLPLVSDPALQQEWRLILQAEIGTGEISQELVSATRQALGDLLDVAPEQADKDLLVCACAQLLHAIGLSTASQSRLMDRLCAYL